MIFARKVEEVRAYVQKFQKTQRAAEQTMEMYEYVPSVDACTFFVLARYQRVCGSST